MKKLLIRLLGLEATIVDLDTRVKKLECRQLPELYNEIKTDVLAQMEKDFIARSGRVSL